MLNVTTASKIKYALNNNDIINIKKKYTSGYTLYTLIIKHIK
jgi:hypothetical protein